MRKKTRTRIKIFSVCVICLGIPEGEKEDLKFLDFLQLLFSLILQDRLWEVLVVFTAEEIQLGCRFNLHEEDEGDTLGGSLFAADP